ncbi:MAG: agmatine deiminase [Puniceicoccaceae bacterium 5H]|nr:MAG: agmatine deiminase [Puniceicoccaceae bacterium 5H]
MPPEWAPQQAVWFSWPWHAHTWPDSKDKAVAEYAAFLATTLRYAPIRIVCEKAQQKAAEKALRAAQADLERVEWVDLPSNDAWIRDFGPTFVQHRETGKLAMVDWQYNAWGGKFAPWDADAALVERLEERLEIPRFGAPFVCEGGAIEVNSQGLCLTTESVLLNENRNRDLYAPTIGGYLKDFLGMKEVMWLERGQATDDTDGHIDTLARFFKDDGIVAIRTDDSHHHDYEALQGNRERLEGLRTPTGGRFDIAWLPLPDPIHVPGAREEFLPASYANFLIVNEGVLVPFYGQPRQDDHARGLIQELFPKHEVVGVSCRELVWEGGAAHCLSQQMPV